MSSYISAAINGITKSTSYYYNRITTSEAQANELSAKVAGYFENEAKNLLEAGIHPKNATRDGKPLLSYTVIEQNDVFIEPLVTYGADIDGTDIEGKTALHHAVIGGTLHAISELLRLGADPDLQDDVGLTPLHYAVRDHKPQKVDALVKGGADTEIKSLESGRKPEEMMQELHLETYNALHPQAPLTREGLYQREMDELLGK